jgi:dicarboxylate transporter 10
MPMEWSTLNACGLSQIVLVRMCTDAVKPTSLRYGYRNCFDGLYRVVKEEGVSVLYRGTAPNVLRSVSMSE